MGVTRAIDQKLQHLNVKGNKPSKYKAIHPTPLSDLMAKAPAKYKEVPKSEIDSLYEGCSVKVVFDKPEIRCFEAVWLHVEATPQTDDDDAIYCKATEPPKNQYLEYQANQRVQIKKKHVVAIYHEED
eukprot:jgi/Botrbrau1/8156/Bobra.357_2s0004.1